MDQDLIVIISLITSIIITAILFVLFCCAYENNSNNESVDNVISNCIAMGLIAFFPIGVIIFFISCFILSVFRH